MNVCPLHLVAVCPCTVGNVTEWELDRAYALGLWECDRGHRTVAAPVLNGFNNKCMCGRRTSRISTCIVKRRPAQTRLAS